VRNHITVRPAADRADGEIEAEIRDALLRNPHVNHRNIRVDVLNNKAHLRGNAGSTFEREKAEEIAGRVKGVFGIRNDLTTSAGMLDRLDEEIEADIEDQLRWSPFIDGEAVTVSVQAGIATLQGRVRDARALRIAEQEARQGGALVVINELRIAPP
jgi:osmotically-inducible protein OsmY